MKFSGIKLVIFDLDGTLVDAYQAVSASLNHALSSCGYAKLDDYTVQRSVGWGEKVLIQKFVKPQHIDQVLSVYRVHHRAALRSGTKFLPGAREILDELKGLGFRLAIASNRPSPFTHIILKHLNVREHFDMVVCADEVPQPKPASDMLDRIVTLKGIRRDQELYVGDMTIDVETGKNAGIRIVSVLTGSSTREEIEALAPDMIIENISKLKCSLTNAPGK